MMRLILIVLLALGLSVSGCKKKDGGSTDKPGEKKGTTGDKKGTNGTKTPTGTPTPSDGSLFGAPKVIPANAELVVAVNVKAGIEFLKANAAMLAPLLRGKTVDQLLDDASKQSKVDFRKVDMLYLFGTFTGGEKVCGALPSAAIDMKTLTPAKKHLGVQIMKDTKGGHVASLGVWAVGCDKEDVVMKMIDVFKGKAPGFDGKAENFKTFAALGGKLTHGLLKGVLSWSVLKASKAPVPVTGNAIGFGFDLNTGVTVVGDFPPASVDATKTQLDTLLKQAKAKLDATVKQMSASPEAAKMKPVMDKLTKIVAALDVKKHGSMLQLDVPIKASDVMASLMPLMMLMK